MKAHVMEVLEDGRERVINTIEVENLGFMENLRDAALGGKIGDTYDSETGTYTSPPPAPPAPQLRRITVLAFRNRFTQAEKVAIDLASIDDPAASMTVRQQQAAIRVSLADMAVATYIDLDRPDTRAGVTMLEGGGILAAGRALQVLDAEILASERPQ